MPRKLLCKSLPWKPSKNDSDGLGVVTIYKISINWQWAVSACFCILLFANWHSVRGNLKQVETIWACILYLQNETCGGTINIRLHMKYGSIYRKNCSLILTVFCKRDKACNWMSIWTQSLNISHGSPWRWFYLERRGGGREMARIGEVALHSNLGDLYICCIISLCAFTAFSKYYCNCILSLLCLFRYPGT